MTTIEKIRHLMEDQGLSQNQLAKLAGITQPSLNKLLKGNGEDLVVFGKVFTKIAEGLGVTPTDLIDDDITPLNTNNIYGYIEYNGEVKKIKSFKELEKIYLAIKEEVQSDPKKITSLINKNIKNEKIVKGLPKKTLDEFKKEIVMGQEDTYDLETSNCWSFRKGTDERANEDSDDKFAIALGNMCDGFPFSILGTEFRTSEHAYICGMFSERGTKNDEKQREAQVVITEKTYEKDGVKMNQYHGYSVKKEARRKYERWSREDWSDGFNVEWMKYVVWNKVVRNADFRRLLCERIPLDAMIIENSTSQTGSTASLWGAKNQNLENARKAYSTYYKREHPQASKAELQQKENEINYVGTFVGKNWMGKILKLCQMAIIEGGEPPIDYDLLKSKHIYLIDTLLTFDNEEQRPIWKVENNTLTPKSEDKPTDDTSKAIEVAPEPKKRGRKPKNVIVDVPVPTDVVSMPITNTVVKKVEKVKTEKKAPKEGLPTLIERVPPTLTEDGKYRCLGVGRIVMDVIKMRNYEGKTFGRGDKYTETIIAQEVGGNCGNVMCNLSAFGKVKTYPIAQLGTSKVARYIKQDFERFGCDTRYVTLDEKGKTTLFGVTHKINSEGEIGERGRGYYDVFGVYTRQPELSNLRTRNGEDVELVNSLDFTPHYFFFDNAVPAHRVIASALKARGAMAYLELNKIKENSEKEDKYKKAKSFVEVADIVKCSREDVPNIEYFQEYFADKLIIQTMDEDGLRYNLRNQGWVQLPPMKRDDVVDFEGAGDMTTATFINALASRDITNIEALTDEVVRDCLMEAQTYASECVCYYSSKGMFYENSKWNIPRNNLTEPLIGGKTDKPKKRMSLNALPLKDIREYDKDKCLAYNSQFEILNGKETKFSKRGECSVLSNFYTCEMHYNGMTFNSAEQMYHYYKFQGNKTVQDNVMACKKGLDVMNACKDVSVTDKSEHERTRWKYMTLAIETKFLCCKEFRDKVIASGTIDLVEVQVKKCDVHGATASGDMAEIGGTWNGHDVTNKFIGMSGCGRIMMAVRDKFRGKTESEILSYQQPTDLEEWWNDSPIYSEQLGNMGKHPTKGIVAAIYGDIIGVPYEWRDNRTKDFAFELREDRMRFTDDTILTTAIADWLLNTDRSADSLKPIMLRYANEYITEPFWGENFRAWVAAKGGIDRKGIASNGAAMRVSPIAWVAKSLDEALKLAEISARLTHDSDEAVRGAQSVVAASYMALHGESKTNIKTYIEGRFGYNLNRSIESIRKDYKFEHACDKCVPESIICWLQSDTYEEAIRNVVSLGGDADTMAAICGSICGATPNMQPTQLLAMTCYQYLTIKQKTIIDQFNETYVENACESGAEMDRSLLKPKEYSLEWLKERIEQGETFDYCKFFTHKQKGKSVDNSCFSQWYMRDFVIDGITYNCAEQWMMASKARLFGDEESLGKILKATKQGVIKKLGKGVKGFDESIWSKNCFDIVVKGNIAKFTQNEDLKQYLLGTGNQILVEASPYDKIWGIGMDASNNNSSDPYEWNGTNLLGFALTKVRDGLKPKLMYVHGSASSFE